MNLRIAAVIAILFVAFASQLWALDYPAAPNSATDASADDRGFRLQNAIVDAQWTLDAGRISATDVSNKRTGQTLHLKTGNMPKIVFDDGRTVDLAALTPIESPRTEDDAIISEFKDDASGLAIRWSVKLDDTANYLIQKLELTAERDVKIKELVFIDSTIEVAKQIGQVDGSVVVCGDIFLAVEHPLAKNIVGKDSHVRCALPRGNVLGKGQTWTYSSVFGVVEPGQLRRGFLAYLERRRARPYRQFLHYNNWYDVILARRTERITEPECLEAIEAFGRELIRKRGVKMEAFVWDDGWDDFNTLWDFHKGFPNGFRNLIAAAAKYDAAQGVWMSPWGGYATAKRARIEFGKSQGYETNANGFSMAGEKYGKAFRDVCLNMMREQGVIFFKFDGMGGGNKTTGAQAEMADDIDAVLELSRALRRENPDVFISATVGTWASPFWTLYADSVWRQGGDTGFFGKGDTRQQWITYRDMWCHDRIVQLGPLYPLNSLMLHGPVVCDRKGRNPTKMAMNDKSAADEFWSFFGSGTNLQELYVTPRAMTEKMWDELAAAAKWSRANSDVLVDTHWIGGNPGKGEVYGWASWQPRGGTVCLRNPSDKPAVYELKLARDLELPDEYRTDYRLKSPRKNQRIGSLETSALKSLRIELEPFEVLVFDVTAVPDAEERDADTRRKRPAD